MPIGHIGIYTPIILGPYLLAVRTVFIYERDHRAAFVEGAAERYPEISLKSATLRFAGASVVVVAAGIWLPFVGSDLADAMGWQTTFVGTLFVAGATSLPELVVTMSALRIGAVNSGGISSWSLLHHDNRTSHSAVGSSALRQ